MVPRIEFGLRGSGDPFSPQRNFESRECTLSGNASDFVQLTR
jgi:hypothetical protein